MKMELYDFIEQYNLNEVSIPGLLKQREKLNENVFKDLNHKSMKNFYNLFLKEVKTYKGYILIVIGGNFL